MTRMQDQCHRLWNIITCSNKLCNLEIEYDINISINTCDRLWFFPVFYRKFFSLENTQFWSIILT